MILNFYFPIFHHSFIIKQLLLDNNTELESFFKDFEDCSPVTEQEKKEAEKLYENIMKDEQEEYCVEEKDEEGHY